MRAILPEEPSVARKVTESSDNVFLDLGFPPHEAEVMLLRAKLAEALRVWMEREKLTQAGLCAKAGIPVGLRLAA